MSLIINTPRTSEALRKLDRLTLNKKMEVKTSEALASTSFVPGPDIRKAKKFFSDGFNLRGDFVCEIVNIGTDLRFQCMLKTDIMNAIAGRVYFKDKVFELPVYIRSFANIPDVPAIKFFYYITIGEDGNPTSDYPHGRLDIGGESITMKPGTFVEHICTLEQLYTAASRTETLYPGTSWTVTSIRLPGPIIVRGIW